MDKYVGGWSANGGTSYGYGITGNNFRKLRKLLRDTARGNVFANNFGCWSIVRFLDGELIADGMVRG